MRKYQQLLLLIFSIVCIVTLLFYRNEYLKLRSVLSVLNIFGSVEVTNATCLLFNNDLTRDISSKYQFQEPRSVWSKFEDHYFYSSFWETDDNGSFIRTTVIGPKTAFYNYKCRIWFEEGDIIVSEEGIVQHDLDRRSLNFNSTLLKYFLRCMVQNRPSLGVPYGVLWSTTSNNRDRKILSPVYYKSYNEFVDSTICVLPDYSALPKTQIVEFIAYYNSIGVNDFIIYDTGIQHSIIPFLESVSGRNGFLNSVSVIQWNFPVINSDLELLTLKDDCLSRTFGKSKFVGVVSWEDYIVPKKYNFNKIISVNKIVDLLHLTMKRMICCSNSKDDELSKVSWPMFLRKTHCVKHDVVKDRLFVNLKSYGNMDRDRIYEMSENDVSFNQYVFCNDSLQKKVSTIKVPDMINNIKSHKMLDLWKSHLNTNRFIG